MEILINLFLIILGSLNCIKFLTPEAPLDLKIIGSLFMIFFGMKAFPIKKYKEQEKIKRYWKEKIERGG